jgi:hypothetical protein
MTPREFFPKMPDEVFDMWLSPFIEEIGWPFKSDTETTKGTRWENLFGIDRSLRDWAACSWMLIDIDTSRFKISTSSQFTLHALIQSANGCKPAEMVNLSNTEQRFRACAEFIVESGRIPAPIIAVFSGDEFDIIDGNHRIAALAHIGVPKGYKIPAWVPKFK